MKNGLMEMVWWLLGHLSNYLKILMITFNTENMDAVFDYLESGKLKTNGIDETGKLIDGDVIDLKFD